MDGQDITGLPPHDLFHKGLLRTFQIAHEFASMSVRENLMMVPAQQSGETLWNTWFGRKRIAEEECALQAKADEVIEFLTIGHLKDEKAGNLSGGQKKLLENRQNSCAGFQLQSRYCSFWMATGWQIV